MKARGGASGAGLGDPAAGLLVFGPHAAIRWQVLTPVQRFAAALLSMTDRMSGPAEVQVVGDRERREDAPALGCERDAALDEPAHRVMPAAERGDMGDDEE